MANLTLQYSEEHPHYTPKWLSERVASHVPGDFEGRIVDPACGAGNLLAAAVLRTDAANRSPRELEFVGTDISRRAVKSCARTLATLLPAGNFRIEQFDFLKAKNPRWRLPSAILMNPPFAGYGELHSKVRKQVVRRLGLKGRFNLSHAFVQRAIAIYRPSILVSILPSNWLYSRASAFRTELTQLGGGWEWEEIGDCAFPRLSTHVGILIWRRNGLRSTSRVSQAGGEYLANLGIEVKQGVATGLDAAFGEMASLTLSIGERVEAVRGRDVERGTGTSLWVPPSTIDLPVKRDLSASVPRRISRSLRQRACVTKGKRATFQYQESVPAWFLKVPKLLLPEISWGTLRVELDELGERLPLHSVIAVRVPSIEIGRALRQHLQSKHERELFIAAAPRLNGGAIRMQVGAIRDSVSRWALAAGLVQSHEAHTLVSSATGRIRKASNSATSPRNRL